MVRLHGARKACNDQKERESCKEEKREKEKLIRDFLFASICYFFVLKPMNLY